MISIRISNQARIDKKQGRIYNEKLPRSQYQKRRNEVHHRVQRLLRKQNSNIYECYSSTDLEINSYIKQEAQKETHKLIRFWAGSGVFRGLQFKKLGRMDKVKLKQSQKEDQDDSIQSRNNLAQLKWTFSRLDNKYKKYILALGLMHIHSCKKPSRHVAMQPFFTIPYW